jgi:hypothetical protein
VEDGSTVRRELRIYEPIYNEFARLCAKDRHQIVIARVHVTVRARQSPMATGSNPVRCAAPNPQFDPLLFANAAVLCRKPERRQR